MYKFLLIILFLIPFRLSAQKAINLDLTKAEIPLTHADFYLDDKGLTFEEVKKASFQKNFKPLETFLFGFTDQSVWIKFKLKNNDNSINDWVLDVGKDNITLLELYHIDINTKKWKVKKMGTSLQYSERFISVRKPVMSILIDAYTTQDYYLKIESSTSINLEPIIHSKASFLKMYTQEEFYYGLMMGILCFTFLSASIWFLGAYNKPYIYFAIFTFFQTLFALYINGYLHGILPLTYSIPLIHFLFMFASIGINLFSVTFLDLKKHKNSYKAIFTSLGIIIFCFPITFFVTIVTGVKMLTLLSLLSYLVISIVNLVLMFQGVKQTKFYFIGSFGFLIISIVFLLFSLQIVPPNFITRNPITIATVWSVIFFYIAIIDKQRREIRLKYQSATDKLAAQEKFNLKLEKEVSNRTKELQDVNADLEENKHELEKNQLMLEKSNKSKDKLITIIAHDFKSPLNSLKGAVSLIKLGMLSNDELLVLSTKLEDQIGGTLEFVNNLLYWTKNQMDGIVLKSEEVNLVDITSNVISLLNPIAQNKAINLHWDENQKEALVWADEITIDIVIRNLISNAIKFTNLEGNIHISLREELDCWEVCVKDDGVGMTPLVREQLFESEESTTGTSAEKGTGLGLTLCKDFVEKNGGSIWVNSKANEGTSFFFKLYKKGKNKAKKLEV